MQLYITRIIAQPLPRLLCIENFKNMPRIVIVLFEYTVMNDSGLHSEGGDITMPGDSVVNTSDLLISDGKFPSGSVANTSVFHISDNISESECCK